PRTRMKISYSKFADSSRASNISPSILANSAVPKRSEFFSVALRKKNSERRSEEHTSELQSRFDLVCRLLLEKKNCDERRMHPSGVDTHRRGRGHAGLSGQSV